MLVQNGPPTRSRDLAKLSPPPEKQGFGDALGFGILGFSVVKYPVVRICAVGPCKLAGFGNQPTLILTSEIPCHKIDDPSECLASRVIPKPGMPRD